MEREVTLMVLVMIDLIVIGLVFLTIEMLVASGTYVKEQRIIIKEMRKREKERERSDREESRRVLQETGWL